MSIIKNVRPAAIAHLDLLKITLILNFLYISTGCGAKYQSSNKAPPNSAHFLHLELYLSTKVL